MQRDEYIEVLVKFIGEHSEYFMKELPNIGLLDSEKRLFYKDYRDFHKEVRCFLLGNVDLSDPEVLRHELSFVHDLIGELAEKISAFEMRLIAHQLISTHWRLFEAPFKEPKVFDEFMDYLATADKQCYQQFQSYHAKFVGLLDKSKKKKVYRTFMRESGRPAEALNTFLVENPEITAFLSRYFSHLTQLSEHFDNYLMQVLARQLQMELRLLGPPRQVMRAPPEAEENNATSTFTSP